MDGTMTEFQKLRVTFSFVNEDNGLDNFLRSLLTLTIKLWLSVS